MGVDGRVLSLQSHVVYGYVGNKSATFPLQVLGLEVDAINSVQFSNHTGYAHVKGQVMNATQLDDLLEGLHLNDLTQNNYTHLLTGYIGSESFLRTVKKAVHKLKKDNPQLLYVCDPVMGDNGKMYVPAELLPIYREEIVALADIITPNQYEAELLSGMAIKTEADVGPVMAWFHERGVQTVVLSSTDLGNEQHLIAIASTKKTDGSTERVRIAMPRLPVNFTGTGDLFAALFLSWLHKTHHNIAVSLENTVASMQAVLRATISHALKAAQGQQGPDCGQQVPDCCSPQLAALLKGIAPRHLELRLVQSLEAIRNPQPTIRATPLGHS